MVSTTLLGTTVLGRPVPVMSKAGDPTNAISGNKTAATINTAKIKEADFVIIAVITPVTKVKDPDLGLVISSAEQVGKNLKKGAITVLESTVFPCIFDRSYGHYLIRDRSS